MKTLRERLRDHLDTREERNAALWRRIFAARAAERRELAFERYIETEMRKHERNGTYRDLEDMA